MCNVFHTVQNDLKQLLRRQSCLKWHHQMRFLAEGTSQYALKGFWQAAALHSLPMLATYSY